MADHTPGPWDVVDYHGDKVIRAPHAVSSAGFPLLVCRVLHSPERPAASDARLIAAAPELLAVLREARGHLDYCRELAEFDRFEIEALLARLDAAVAKAAS